MLPALQLLPGLDFGLIFSLPCGVKVSVIRCFGHEVVKLYNMRSECPIATKLTALKLQWQYRTKSKMHVT